MFAPCAVSSTTSVLDCFRGGLGAGGLFIMGGGRFGAGEFPFCSGGLAESDGLTSASCISGKVASPSSMIGSGSEEGAFPTADRVGVSGAESFWSCEVCLVNFGGGGRPEGAGCLGGSCFAAVEGAGGLLGGSCFSEFGGEMFGLGGLPLFAGGGRAG